MGSFQFQGGNQSTLKLITLMIIVTAFDFKYLVIYVAWKSKIYKEQVTPTFISLFFFLSLILNLEQSKRGIKSSEIYKHHSETFLSFDFYLSFII